MRTSGSSIFASRNQTLNPYAFPNKINPVMLKPTQIDFTAVGASTNLKPPAARMRYTRLRRQIESGTLIGTHGTPFPSDKVVEKNAEAGRKRKRLSPGKCGREDTDGETLGDDGSKKSAEHKRAIKKEGGGSEGFESSAESESEFADSEDEMPLAKLMKTRNKTSGGLRNHMAGRSNVIDGAESRGIWEWQ